LKFFDFLDDLDRLINKVMDKIDRMIRDLDKEINRLDSTLKSFDRMIEESERRIIPVDIIDEGNRLVILADLPGFEKDEIDVYISGKDLLVIKAERKERFGIRRRIEKYYRSIKLPSYADIDNIKVRYKNGVLEIIVPLKRRKIKIE